MRENCVPCERGKSDQWNWLFLMPKKVEGGNGHVSPTRDVGCENGGIWDGNHSEVKPGQPNNQQQRN